VTFIQQTHCSKGHDLRIHGVLTLGIYRCNLCHASRQRRMMNGRPMKVWAPGWKKGRKDEQQKAR
jgi:hypothetical protein